MVSGAKESSRAVPNLPGGVVTLTPPRGFRKKILYALNTIARVYLVLGSA